MESGSDGFVSCPGGKWVVVSPASSLRSEVTSEQSYIQGRQWAVAVGLGLQVLASRVAQGNATSRNLVCRSGTMSAHGEENDSEGLRAPH